MPRQGRSRPFVSNHARSRASTHRSLVLPLQDRNSMIVTVDIVKVALVATLAAAFVALVAVQPSAASSYAQFGVQDDAWLMYGPGTLDHRLDTLDRLGVKIVRLTVRWDQVAPTKPSNERDPFDPAYVWGAYGA